MFFCIVSSVFKCTLLSHYVVNNVCQKDIHNKKKKSEDQGKLLRYKMKCNYNL